MNKSRKLSKTKLNAKWKDGGRETSKWCNYYLVSNDNYLVEKANVLAYLVSLLLSPLIILLILLGSVYWLIEKLHNKLNVSITPVTVAFSTLFRKNKVRTDTIRKGEYSSFEGM